MVVTLSDGKDEQLSYETVLWLAPTLIAVAVFLTVLAVFWPRPEAPVPHPLEVAARRHGRHLAE